MNKYLVYAMFKSTNGKGEIVKEYIQDTEQFGDNVEYYLDSLCEPVIWAVYLPHITEEYADKDFAQYAEYYFAHNK